MGKVFLGAAEMPANLAFVLGGCAELVLFVSQRRGIYWEGHACFSPTLQFADRVSWAGCQDLEAGSLVAVRFL